MQLIFCVYDSKAEVYGKPFFLQSVGLAKRGFTEAANDPSSEICKYAEDFSLFQLGSFDEQTGRIETLQAPVHLESAMHVKIASVAPPERVC